MIILMITDDKISPQIPTKSVFDKLKEIMGTPKYYWSIVVVIFLILTSIFIYKFLNSTVKIGEITSDNTAIVPTPTKDDNNISEPAPYPVDNNPNLQPAPNFSITNLDKIYKAKPYNEFSMELKLSNFAQSGGFDNYIFGVGDCSSDLSNCRTDNYAEYTYIDDFGYFHLIPTQTKTYNIPIWVLYQNNLFKGSIKIDSSDKHADNAENLIAYSINIPFPYKEALKDPQYVNLGNLDVVKRVEPKTDCAQLNKRVDIREYNPYSCEVLSFKARGDKTIGIVYILPEGYELPKQKGKDQIDILDDKNGVVEYCRYNAQQECDGTEEKSRYLTFYYTSTFYKDQAKKYGITDLNFKLKSYGRFRAKNVPHYGYDRDMPKLESVFNEAIGSSTLEKIKSETDIIAYVYFDLDRGSQKSAFVSTVQNGNLYVNVTPVSEDFIKNTSYYNLASSTESQVDTFIHELGHIFNASDKYKVSESRTVTTGCDIEGLAEPDKNPLFPQTKVDVYCGSTFESQKDFDDGKGSNLGLSYYTVIDQGKILFNKYTAKEFGWIK